MAREPSRNTERNLSRALARLVVAGVLALGARGEDHACPQSPEIWDGHRASLDFTAVPAVGTY